MPPDRPPADRPPAPVGSDPRPSRASGALVPVLLVALVLVLGACAVFGGLPVVTGVAVGLALVALFLLGGRLPVLLEVPPGAAFLFLGINYLFRVVLLLLALVALHGRTWLDPKATGLAVIVGALCWNALALRRYLTKAQPAIDPGEKVSVSPGNDIADPPGPGGER